MDLPSNRTGTLLAPAIGVALIIYILVRGFSESLGIDVAAGVRLLFSISICVALVCYATWNELTGGFIGYKLLLPLALSTLWSGLWPAMNYWGAKPLYLPGMPIEDVDVEWWASAYMQWGGFLVLLIGGYAIAYWIWRR